MSRLNWLNNGFISKEHYAPFVVGNDSDYYDDLCKRYNGLIKCAKDAGADDESISILKHDTKMVRDALKEYYKGNISRSHTKIQNIIKGCLDSTFAVESVLNSDAFPGVKGSEIQLFRARISDNAVPYAAKDMLHLPFKLRGKTGNYRFSIPGVPSLYLGNSSYACWLELGRPSEHDFVVSPVLLDGTQRIFNLAVMNRDFHKLNEFDEERVHSWLKLLILMIATSYRIKEERRTFRSEYIVSQGIMLACKKLGLDGIAYYSKQVEDELFSQSAINLALFATFKQGQDYSEICKHIKVGDSFNYQMFRQLGHISTDKNYELRCIRTGISNMIGSYNQQYEYCDTEFCRFDKFLFADWRKDEIEFGNALIKA